MDTTMLWAAVTSGFIHFFPLRRDHSSISSGIQPSRHPAYGDVAVDNVQNPSVVHFHLKRSKCDQLGTKLMCSSVTVGLCLVTAVLIYITQSGDGPGAFFLLEGGRPLTKAYFIARVQAALRSAGVQFSDYTGHSCSPSLVSRIPQFRCSGNGAALPSLVIS